VQNNPYAASPDFAEVNSLKAMKVTSPWLRLAVILLCASCAIGPINFLIRLPETMSLIGSIDLLIYMVWAIGLVFLIFHIWLTYKISRARPWARNTLLAYVIVQGISFWMSATALAPLQILPVILQCISLGVLFLSPAKYCFTSNKSVQ
jgi:hypothetical protein